jgi:hypothetical protein
MTRSIPDEDGVVLEVVRSPVELVPSGDIAEVLLHNRIDVVRGPPLQVSEDLLLCS